DQAGNPLIVSPVGAYLARSMDYIQCPVADCSTSSIRTVPGTWSDTASIATDSGGLAHIIAQQGQPGVAVEHIAPKVPDALEVENVLVLPTGTSGDFGCTPSTDFGIELDIQYQVLDQMGQNLADATMVPHEINYGANNSQSENDICPSRIST